MSTMPKILITNDDGVHAKGLFALYDAVKALGDVTVVSPLLEQSGVGHAITMIEPLRILEIPLADNKIMYGLKGTPADCVKIAVNSLMDTPPDIVLSGINQGSNTALNVLYSGTVAAAREGAILGIPSAAISLASHTFGDFSYASEIAGKVARLLLSHPLPVNTMLNVNVPAVPAERITGIRITRQGMSRFKETYVKEADQRGKLFFWLTGQMKNLDIDDSLTDTHALSEQAVSITPIHFDLTDEPFRETLASAFNPDASNLLKG